jgi:hypothetical protein
MHHSQLLIGRAINLHGHGIGIGFDALGIDDDAFTAFAFGDTVSCSAEVEDLLLGEEGCVSY